MLSRREERVSTADLEKKLSPRPASLWKNVQPERAAALNEPDDLPPPPARTPDLTPARPW